MKIIISFLIFVFSITYQPNDAVTYARHYCKYYNSAYSYSNYPETRQNDDAKFVSQCLIAGGQKLDGCPNVNRYGLISSISNLRSCLQQKGWKSSKTKPPNFRAGYPMIKLDLSHAIIATLVSGSSIYYSAHSPDTCDRKLDSKLYYYFYL